MIRVVAAAILDGPRLLAALRSPQMSSPDLWELPGGKVERGESDRAALVREIEEELGVRIRVDDPIGVVRQGRIELVAFSATLVEGVPEAREHAELRWVEAESLRDLTWAPADRPFLADLADRLARMG